MPASSQMDSRDREKPPEHLEAGQRWPLLLLVLILLLAAACRLYRLLPVETGLLYAQDADEGVYATTAQLMLQGHLPYRDFFTPMPPLAIYLFMAVLRLVYHPWGSPMGLMALRYTSVAFGLIAVLLTYHLAKMVGGNRAALLAASLLAIDGIVVAQDRRAMLESPTNLLSCLALLCYLRAMQQSEAGRSSPTRQERGASPQALSQGSLPPAGPMTGPGPGKPARPMKAPERRLCLQVVAAGAFCALGMLVKGTALVPPLLIILTILIRRRWHEVGWFGASFVLTYGLGAAVFLLNCPQDYVRQMYFFHMLRPWDGTAHPLARLREMWSYPWSWTTVRIGLAGIALTVFAGRQVRNRSLCFVVVAWAGLVVLLLLSSRTYWATYFSQLAIPLAILGGCLLNEEMDHTQPGPLNGLPVPPRQAWPLLQGTVLVGVILIGVSLPYRPAGTALRRQYSSTLAALEQTKPAYIEISNYIRESVPPEAPILTFETNYTFLSSHPPAGADDESFFIDSYGEMLYRNLGIADSSIADLLAIWANQERTTVAEIFHLQPAQDMVLAAFGRAPYVVLDQRAQKQLSQDTGTFLSVHSELLKAAPATELRQRTAQ